MADFSINATQLSEPGGAGAQTTAPVQGTIFDGGAGEALSSLFSGLIKGAKDQRKMDLEEHKNYVVSAYSKRQATINEAGASGQLTPAEMGARSRALYNEFAAGYSQFAPDLEKAAAGFRGYTEMGVAEEKVKSDAQMRADLFKQVQSAGYPIDPSQPKATQDVFIKAYQTNKRIDEDTQRIIRDNTEARQQGEYAVKITERQSKEQSIQLLNEAVRANLPTVFAHAEDIARKVKEGTLSVQDGQMQMEAFTAKIDAQLTTLAANDPTLASSFRTLFDGAKKASLSYLDPKSTAETLKAQKDTLLYGAEITLLSNPKIATLAGVSQLIQNYPASLLDKSDVSSVVNNLIELQETKPGQMVKTVTGTEAEKGVVDQLKKVITGYNQGSLRDQKVAKEQLVPTIHNYLTQLGELQGKGGLGPKSLQEASNLLADPQFGKFMAENPAPASAMKAVTQVMQANYEATAIELVDKALNKTISTSGIAPMRAITGASVEGKSKPLAADQITINFNGSTVSFEPKIKGSSSEAGVYREATKELQQSADAINRLIRIRAHMSGSTDYAATWEATKYVLMPRFYPTRPGTIIHGQKYVGKGNPGDWTDPSNYVSVEDKNE